MKTLFFYLAAAILIAAQEVPPVQSPEVHPDKRVTLRFRDPNAKNVVLDLEGRKDPIAMQRDAEGVWSVTTDPLAPELYGYSFTADGAELLDPFNPLIKPNLLRVQDMVDVPGDSPLPWEMQDIPHGIIHHHFYRSSVIGDNRDFYVYTPPGYDDHAQTLYPVLYLLHGYSDEANAWTVVGKANLILDSLIAQKKAKPMIIVMPLGYGAPEIVQRTPVFAATFRNPALREKNFAKFRQALMDEVMPMMERMYRVAANRDSRAIAGLSMGGSEALLTGLNRLEQFSWIGSFSAGGLGDDFKADFPQLNAADNRKIHLLWIACGTEDRLIAANRALKTWLKTKDVRFTDIETPGMHTWMVWRSNLIDFAPLLFRAGPVNGSSERASNK